MPVVVVNINLCHVLVRSFNSVLSSKYVQYSLRARMTNIRTFKFGIYYNKCRISVKINQTKQVLYRICSKQKVVIEEDSYSTFKYYVAVRKTFSNYKAFVSE